MKRLIKNKQLKKKKELITIFPNVKDAPMSRMKTNFNFQNFKGIKINVKLN